MNIKVRYFASLRDRMGRSEEQVDVNKDKITVADVWKQISNQPMPETILVAVNMEYTDKNHELKGGDEVAFFPPVTGG